MLSTHVLPLGVLDTAGVLPTLQNKTASYALWSNKMKSDYRGSGLATLESVNSLDLWELKLMAVNPLQYTKGVGGKESYVLVFIPGYHHKQENQEELNCKSYRMGYLLYGNAYVPGQDASWII